MAGGVAWRAGGVAGTCPSPCGTPSVHSPSPPLPQFRCCGVSNYTDWFEVYNATRVPDSCCLEFSESCGLHAPGTWWKAVSLCPLAGRGPAPEGGGPTSPPP